MPRPHIVEVTQGPADKLVAVTDKDLGEPVKNRELLYEVDAPELRRLQQSSLQARENGELERVTRIMQRLRWGRHGQGLNKYRSGSDCDYFDVQGGVTVRSCRMDLNMASERESAVWFMAARLPASAPDTVTGVHHTCHRIHNRGSNNET